MDVRWSLLLLLSPAGAAGCYCCRRLELLVRSPGYRSSSPEKRKGGSRGKERQLPVARSLLAGAIEGEESSELSLLLPVVCSEKGGEEERWWRGGG